jgi:hypothetical protein
VLPLRVTERHAQIALDAPFHQRPVVGEPVTNAGRVVTQVAAHHLLAGGADHIPLDVVGDPVLAPERQGAHPRAAGKLGHEGVVRPDGPRQVVDEGLKEVLPG